MKKLLFCFLFQTVALFAISQVSVGFKFGSNKQIGEINLPRILYGYQPTIIPERDATFSYAFSIQSQLSQFFSIRIEPSYFQLNRFKKINFSTSFAVDKETYGTRINSKIEHLSLPVHIVLSPTAPGSRVLFNIYIGTGLGFISNLSSEGETFERLGWGNYINHPLSFPDITDYPFEKRLYSLICFGMEMGIKIKDKHAVSVDANLTNHYFFNKDYAKYALDQFGAMNIGLRYLFVLGVE